MHIRVLREVSKGKGKGLLIMIITGGQILFLLDRIQLLMEDLREVGQNSSCFYNQITKAGEERKGIAI